MYVNQNTGFQIIARHLTACGYKTRKGGTWNSATLRGMISNEHYIGKVRWNWRQTVNVVEDGEISKTRPRNTEYYLVDGKHPAIISNELFERAQAIVKEGKNPSINLDKKLRNPLAGLVYCQCGKAMIYRTYKTAEGKERNAPRLLCINQMYCNTQSATFDEVLSKVKDVLKSCIADFEIKIENDSENTLINHNNNIKRLENKLDELNKKELSQWEKYAEEAMPKAIFDKLNEKVLEEKGIVIKALETARATAPTVEDYKERLMRFTDAVNALDDPNAPVQLKNRLLRACIERIDYKREKGNRWKSTEMALDITLKV